jgi:EAL domain-containing protein (putative c-di-GMP-specific phosphodiesterase class I)
VDYVKVDTSFVRGIDQNDGNREFLAGLCKMVHGIGIMVIAVGVQNQQELDTLAALGFDGVTGPAVLEPG